ncbi:carboxylesterase family domain-containing protein [Phthorimaea operculella]|nr:carboxylesterase family domain-containing protein [Phthorimaea operculella]
MLYNSSIYIALALRWIYDNIGPFNGDKDSITLFGPGAGAASAGLLAVAPQTRHIVTKVISQSGSALADWALIEDKFRVQNTSLVFGRLLGCPIDSSWKLVNCLRQGRSFYELGNAQFEPHVGFIPWGPVLENNFTFPGDEWYEGWRQRDWHFLDTTVEDLIKNRQFNPSLRYMTGVTTQEAAYMIYTTVEDLIKNRQFNPSLRYMTGVTTQEAAYMIYNNESLVPNFQINENWFNQKVQEFVLRYNYTLNPRGVYEAIRYMYSYHPDPHNVSAIRDQYIHFLSDFLYRAPTDKMVKLLLEQNVPVYMYVLNTTVEAFRWPEWRQYAHDTEHYFLTGAPFMDQEFFPKKERIERHVWTGNDRNMSHFFMKAYSDFARYGNPTRSRILGVHFEEAKAGQLRYLNLNTTYNSSILLNYRQTELAFWTVYLPTVIGRFVPTYPPITEVLILSINYFNLLLSSILLNYRQTELAFWTVYLPTVIGRFVPTYPPITEYWWEPKQPLQIAFWSVSSACLLLLVLLVVLCMLWRNAKRETDRYYSDDIFMVPDLGDPGVDNNTRSRDNIYEYRDVPIKRPPTPQSLSRATSQPQTLQSLASRPISRASSGSGLSLKEGAVSRTPEPAPRARSRTQMVHGVPQTTV